MRKGFFVITLLVSLALNGWLIYKNNAMTKAQAVIFGGNINNSLGVIARYYEPQKKPKLDQSDFRKRFFYEYEQARGTIREISQLPSLDPVAVPFSQGLIDKLRQLEKLFNEKYSRLSVSIGQENKPILDEDEKMFEDLTKKLYEAGFTTSYVSNWDELEAKIDKFLQSELKK